MIRNLLFALFASVSASVSAFTVSPRSHIQKNKVPSPHRHVELGAQPSSHDDVVKQQPSSYSPIRMDQLSERRDNVGSSKALLTGIAGATTGWLTWTSSALADYYTDGATDDLEIESLPPPYVPIIFAIVIIGGVGLLTSSLGDVMYDEASLGMQSGAQAKKERERSRASYFKKK